MLGVRPEVTRGCISFSNYSNLPKAIQGSTKPLCVLRRLAPPASYTHVSCVVSGGGFKTKFRHKGAEGGGVSWGRMKPADCYGKARTDLGTRLMNKAEIGEVEYAIYD